MSKKWTVTSQSNCSEEQRLLSTLESVMAAQGEQVSVDKESCVHRIQLPERVVYAKSYLRLQPGFKAALTPSRIKTEWKNLFVFKNLAIPTPEILAYGEHRTLFKFYGGALVTAAVEGTEDLKNLSVTRLDLFEDRQWVETVFNQIVDFTRRLHDYRFAHNDLNWRNILVNPDSGEVFFFDSPRGRRWLPPFLEFRLLKDIAHLDKSAPGVLSRTQRLRYYKKYANISRLDKKHKKKVRWILSRTDSGLQKKTERAGK